MIFIAMVAIIVGAMIIYGSGWKFGGGNCGEDSEAVESIRFLSGKRLEKLYLDFEKLYNSNEVREVYSSYGEGDPLPSEFSDLDIVKLRPESGYILVEGCVDHGVILKFGGFNNNTKKNITLFWGEVPPDSGHEIIWSK